MGHPEVYLNLDGEKPKPCPYCELPLLLRANLTAACRWVEIFQRHEESPLTSLIEDEAASCSSLTLLCILWKKRLDYSLLLVSSLSAVERAAVVYSEVLELSHVVHPKERRSGSVTSERTQ